MESTSQDKGSPYSNINQPIPGAFPQLESIYSPHQTLQQAIFARRSEYTKPRRIRIKVGTWNVAALRGPEMDVGGWFLGKSITEALTRLNITAQNESPSSKLPEGTSVKEQEIIAQQEAQAESADSKDSPGIFPGEGEVALYALGLQEIVDITSPTEALRPFMDHGPSNRFKNAIEEVLPPGYQLVVEQQMMGLLLLIYASPLLLPDIKSVSTASVGTGLMGYMGNKGAVLGRLIIGETTQLVFINSHLAAGADKNALERRNWDASQIRTRARFDPISDAVDFSQAPEEIFGNEDFAFWFGDLNYRLQGMHGEDIRHLLTLHTHGEYNLSQPARGNIEGDVTSSGSASDEDTSIPTPSGSDADALAYGEFEGHISDGEDLPPDFDPSSLQTTISSLLPHDELKQQQRERKAFHDGWREGEIKFLPTFKYDIGSIGIFDSSEKRRCPSWCDRILYRTKRDKLAYENMIRQENAARERDEEMKSRGIEQASEDEDVLFEYNPETDAAEDYDECVDSDPKDGISEEPFKDDICLEYYTAHQHVATSDHKPLDAVFTLEYDAVIPELKTKVHQEVVRELDRVENEGRPTVTVIVERSSNQSTDERTYEDSIDFEGVDFGNVRYMEIKRRGITIANTGRVPAAICFMDRPAGHRQSEGPMPLWITTRFDCPRDEKEKASSLDTYSLKPGDACNIDLHLRVQDLELLRSLNDGSAKLEDILVLHVRGGRDHFLPIRGHWLQSSFGCSIDTLIRIPEGGIRKFYKQQYACNHNIKDYGIKWSAPRELFKLTEAIEDLTERTLAEWDMTRNENETLPWARNAGWPFSDESWTFLDQNQRDKLKLAVIESLDSDTRLDTAFASECSALLKLEILASVLLLFLQSLTDGIITEEQWAKLETGFTDRDKMKQQLPPDDERTWILETLSTTPNHNVSFVLLTSMLARITHEITAMKLPMTPRSSTELPTSPRSPRGKSFSSVPEAARKKLISYSLGGILSEVMIRVPELSGGRERERRIREDRMRRVVQAFLADDSG